MRYPFHTPPDFDKGSRPHIIKLPEGYGAIWPRGVTPTDEEWSITTQFVDDLNGFIRPKATSVFVAPSEVLQ